MGYRIETGEAPGEGLARIFTEQMAKLRRDLDDHDIGVPEKVRRARVRCKRIRALLALAQDAIGRKAWKKQNRWWRDLARSLSDVRDLSARVEALDAVKAGMRAEVSESVVARMRAWLELDRVSREAAWDVREALKRFAARLHDAPAPNLDACEGWDALTGRYARSYGKAYAAMHEAAEGDEADLFHEWRKKVKATGLQARLLRERFPQLEPDVNAGRELSNVLGLAQDIDVVLAALEADPSLPLSPREEAELISALITRRGDLFREALELGGRMAPSRREALSVPA